MRKMASPELLLPAALVVGHPGHELRLFRWRERAHPVVFVLTDGSGSGRSRTRSTQDLLEATGSSPGVVLGAFTDVELYQAIMKRDVPAMAAVVERVAESLAAQSPTQLATV